MEKRPNLMRFNFDRWRGDSKLAEGIGVHAPDLGSAFTMAGMMNTEGLRLTFRDTNTCASPCHICEANGVGKEAS